jgi:two-component system osmolarity sensor histidine kinase EnvZ
MRRGPSTFLLVLALIASALLVALTLAGWLSLRTGARTVGDTYAPLAVATALAFDDLSARDDPEARATFARIEHSGVHFSDQAPPPQATRPMLVMLARNMGISLGDPSRVVVSQPPDPKIWVRSARDPTRWIVMQAVNYREQVIDSTVLTTLLAGIVVLVAAALGARVLTRPLERLARNAGALLDGGPTDDLLHSSPREVRSLAVAIGDAGERLRSAARERELMLAGVSHDLRTPLARLRIALELGDAGDPVRRDAMVDDLSQLDGALEQCLAFVRDGRDEAQREIDIVTIAGQLIGLRAQPENWRLDAPPSMQVNVRPMLMRRALANLIDNAERYGEAPYDLTLWRDDGDLLIAVADCGNGVREELLGKLGQPFLRGDPARGGGGSGLGLSIVARIAKLHGGSLRLRNLDNGGFEAQLSVPARRMED